MEEQYVQDLFDCIPEDEPKKMKIIDFWLKKYREQGFIYNIECQDTDLGIFSATLIKEAAYFTRSKVNDTVFYSNQIKDTKKEPIHQNFKYKDKPVFALSQFSPSFEVCVSCIETEKEIERQRKFSEEVNRQNAEYAKQKNAKVKGGVISDAGYAYWNEKMDMLCQNDPGGPTNMRTAIWFYRKERTQRRRPQEEAIENACKKYGVDGTLLFSRVQSNNNFWGIARKM